MYELEFVEFAVMQEWDAEAHIDELSVFVELSDGRTLHLRDYSYVEAEFEYDEKDRLTTVYSSRFSFEIIEGRLFEVTFDLGGSHGSEITIPMLLAGVSYV